MRRKIALAVGHIIVLSIFCLCSSYAAPLTPIAIGGAPDGAALAVPPGATSGYDVSARSRDIGGTSDQFEFAYQNVSGDFDMQARLDGVSITDAFVHAGLMARETLEANSRFAGIFSSSALLGCFFESRASAGANSQQVTPPSRFPANYPQMYLRLRRSGNAFTGYASFDGSAWQQLGTTTIGLPAQLYFGLAVSSLNTNAITTARFRDIKAVTNASAFTYKAIETLGPSNRRTGLVFSEIMYNPAPRQDGNDIEFVEVFNAESVFIDLTGWRISGGIQYQFPDGFRLESGQFAVIAADPGAIERVYGYRGALGPFSGRLNNAGDTLTLLNRADATRLELTYSPASPWPVAADGAGHSLVLARPSYGEDDPRAWSASDKIGGSPGDVDAKWPNSWRNVVLNELLVYSADAGGSFIELYNAGYEVVDLTGCVLTDDVRTNRYAFPNGSTLSGRSFVSLNATELGFQLNPAGQAIYLLNPETDRVIDVIRFAGQEKNISTGRTPDGSPNITRLAAATPGTANNGRRIEDIVINELMYHPITGEDSETYIELHNRSANTVDLSGWQFVDGIDFEFPEGAKIQPGGYAVVANDAAHLIGIYPQLNTNNTFGNFDGGLSNSGERIALAKREFLATTNNLNAVVTNVLYITVGEVTYFDGGRWPELADGGGSSLELIDSRADTTLAANWAASDETTKAPWTTIDFTGKVEMGSAAYPANRLQLLMQGAGECLVDDIEFIPTGSTNVMVNGNFEDTTNSWRFFGNHSRSAKETGAAFSGGFGLHVRSPGDGDTANNAVRGQLTRTITTSGTATLRAKVRWLSGWPEILFRIRGNWFEVPARMDVPKTLGTPGQANSRRKDNVGPAIFAVNHSPAVPRANEAVVVTCRVSDSDGVAAPRLLFRVDPNQTLSTIAMQDDGFGGDALAGDGIYSATITGKPSGSIVAFRIQATDDSAQSATSLFPSDAPARECLIRWDDTIPFGTFAHYHLWNTAATQSARNANPDLDNTYRDATLVYGNSRIIYNVGFRDKGSPYHSGGGDFAVTVPKDELLLGIDDRVFASTGNGGGESTNMKGDVAGWVAEQLGIPFLHSHYMRLYGSQTRDIMYDMEQPNRNYARSWFGGGGVKDDLFKIAIWFEFDDNNSSFNSTGATLQRFLSDGKFKLARYRWNWQIRPSNETANDYSSIYNLVAAANSTTDRIRVLPLLADMEEWMRVFAYHRVTGNWDSYTYNVGQNMYLYTPLGLRAALLPWDIDFVLGDGDAANNTSTLFSSGTDSIMAQLFALPTYKRMLWRAYQDAVNGLLISTNFQPQIDARRAALTKNGVSAGSPSTITSYMNTRRTTLTTQLRANDAPSLYITSNGGSDFTNTTSTVSLTGVAPFAVASIEVNGVPFPITWTGTTNWQITVPLSRVTNVLQITGRDLRGNILTNAGDTITVAYTGAVPQPQEWVVINEINYHSPFPNGDYIELYNRHPSFAFDLSNFRVNGIDYTFPVGSLIQPGGYLVIVQDKAAFAAAYDPLMGTLGPYAGRLQRNGETLRLLKPGATAAEDVLIDEVRYSNTAPWPTAADGFGPSLQLIDPAQDNWRVGNWACTASNVVNQATPGKPNALPATLEPFPKVWLNEIQPVNLSGVRDNAGEPEPWIELYNAGVSTADVGGFFLSDDPDQLTKWQFPFGTQIAPGGFLLIWADGEVTESITGAQHTNFRINSTNGTVLISRTQGSGPAVIDYLTYQVTNPENSYGSTPDGDLRVRRMLFVPTPGIANNATIPDVNVVINEWMAASQAVLRDPADGQFEDWFELYNAGTNTVDLSGYYLTDTQADKTQFQIPAGYRIGPGEYRLIWADGEPLQNAPDRDLHVNFSLRADGEEIALFTPAEELVTAVVFGPQTPNLSEGLYPNGSTNPAVLFSAPTPGTTNTPQFANRPPVISPVDAQSVNEGDLLSFDVLASDADQPAQTLSFALIGPPAGAAIDTRSGRFTWTANETQGPGEYAITVRVTDDGTPSRSTSLSFNVTVREVNLAPVILEISDVSIDEGVPFSYVVPTMDPDFPAQKLSYKLLSAPAGVTFDENSGELLWTPAEDQGPGNYTLTVQVTDSGPSAQSATRSFQVIVRDINNPPIVEEVPVQTVSEGTLFSYQIQARDSETPPAKLTYSLEGTPQGMQINPDTGLITWLPDEAAGPHDYIITVVVSEPGGSPAMRTTFLLGVREVNTAPTLDQIADLVAGPGTFITFTNRFSDSDLPAQALTFTSVGTLPAGASLSTSGVFTWSVPQDPPVGTNRITMRITDDGTPSMSAERSFNIMVKAPFRVAINEIMHRPRVANAEYVELANYSAVTSVDLSGWKLQGYDFTFPSGTVLAPGAFLCVVKNLDAFRTAYGTNGIAMGNAAVSIPAQGGLLRLVRQNEIIDEVLFSLASPWPGAAASNGASLQLIDPWQDHRRVNNWSSSAGNATNAPVQLVSMTKSWKYWQNSAFPGSDWMQSTFNDSAWPAGGALFYVETAALPAAKTTALTIGRMSYYFRTHFDFAGNTNGAILRFNNIIDDGAVFYLNGREIFRVRMPEGAVTQATAAAGTAVGNAILEGPFNYPALGLKQGDNVLAVEVHQQNSGSTDIVFGSSMDAITLTPVSFTPNAPNSVSQPLNTIAPVWINEIVPNNTTALADKAGDFDPWIELYNDSDSPVSLSGWALTDDLSALTKWVFPDNAFIPAHGFLVVWPDGEAAESSVDQPHTSFRINSNSGIVALTSLQSGAPTVIDYVEYSGMSSNQSMGLKQDGNPLTRSVLAASTPAAPNGCASLSSTEILSVVVQNGELRLTWSTSTGRMYRIESAVTLGGSWSPMTEVVGSCGSESFSTPMLDGEKSKFYRVVLLP